MGQTSVLGSPKTEAGVRTLAIPGNVLPHVISHLQRFVGTAAGAWLFATATGTPLLPRNVNRGRASADARSRREEEVSHRRGRMMTAQT